MIIASLDVMAAPWVSAFMVPNPNTLHCTLLSEIHFESLLITTVLCKPISIISETLQAG